MQKLLERVLGASLDRNGWHLCLEIFFSAIFGTALSFNAALAVRLGASNTEVSWLTSGGALVALITVPLAGRFLQKRAETKRLMLAVLTFYRLSAILLILIPLVRLPVVSPGLLLIGTILAFTVPMHFFNVGFNAFLTDAVAFHDRATVFSARNALAGLAVTVFSVVFGGALVVIPFPLNYQLVLSVGLVFALLSSYHLTKVQLAPRAAPAPAPAGPRVPLPQQLRAAWRTLSADTGFVQISINTFVHGLGLWAAGPLYTLDILRELKLGENWIGVTTAVTSVVAIFAYMAWRRIMARWGEPKTLKVSIMLLGLYPLLTGLTGWLPLILFAAVVNGFISAGANLSHFNTFLRVVPPERVHSYTAVNRTVNNIGVMLSPVISVALANVFGFGPVLVGCGLLTFVGSASFLIWPVGETPAAPAPLVTETSAAN